MNALNSKLDALSDQVKVSLNDDTHSQVFAQQIARVKEDLQAIVSSQPGGKRKSVRKIKPYGESQSLRSFLTAIELQMENDRIVGSENKVKYVGNYLEGKAWDWFEPIVRERNQFERENWSARAKRILTNYGEMKKAMQQAFGDLDEKVKAAQKMQRLRQVRSVREYITDFQMIVSNLEWDEEALMDKFREGLKQSVRSLMIYYPQEPSNLEDLYGRAQKIDREQWNERTQHSIGQRGSYFERKVSRPSPKRDRDGDVMMIGAKVDMEKAKKEKLCFNCGKAARFCKSKKPVKREGSTKIGMMTYTMDPGQRNCSMYRFRKIATCFRTKANRI